MKHLFIFNTLFSFLFFQRQIHADNVSSIPNNGIGKAYIKGDILIQYFDSALNKELEYGGIYAMEVIGKSVSGKKEGVFTTYLLDSVNEKKVILYKQEFREDKLNGSWDVYGIEGRLRTSFTYKDNKLWGESKYFKPGSSKIEEIRYHFGDRENYNATMYDSTGTMIARLKVRNGFINDTVCYYYSNGTIMETIVFKDGKKNGTRCYYHPNGTLWIKQVFKDDKHWEVISNYSSDGKSRNPGSLKNGFGTIIYYNDDNTVRDIAEFENGERIK